MYPVRCRIKLEPGGLFAKGIIQGTGYNLMYSQDVATEPCVYCGGRSDSWEHVTPVSLGGRRGNNLVRACRECNMSRGSKPFIVWMLRNHGKVGQMCDLRV